MRDLLDRSDLEASVRLPGGIGIGPSARQSIAMIPELVIEAAAGPVVVLAFDGLSYDLAREVFTPDQLSPLTTTFPSTSVTAWATALTGRRADEHGLLGVQFRLPAEPRLFDCFAETTGRGAPRLPGTVFERLAARGVRCSVGLGEMATWPAWWRSAVTRGATVLPPATDWNHVRYDPGRTVQAAEDEIRRCLRECERGPSLVWSWINVDDYVHRFGHSPELVSALRKIASLAEDLADSGHTVLAFSDHGLVRSRCPDSLLRGWEAATGPDRCSLPSGGAGRVRWCYPKPGQVSTVADRLTDLLGERAIVVRVEQLTELKLLSVDEGVAWALGDVVCLAVGEEFALPVPEVRYEHGSITTEEMVVPLAIWRGR